MKNLKEMILSKMRENGESEEDIQTIHLGGVGWATHRYDGPLPAFNDLEESYVATSLDELDYGGDSGFGSPSFHAFHVYTRRYIYFKRVYDGAESVVSIPRDPETGVIPEGVGGG